MGKGSFLIAGMLLAQVALAQTSTGGLNASELNGKKMFQQRCSICHTHPQAGGKPFGPWLSAESVANEAAARAFIMKGTQRMPGYQYGLEAREIDNIIAYLKTVKKPAAKPQEPKTEDSRDPAHQDI